MYCPNCGQPNHDNNYRCTQCGTILPHDIQPPPPDWKPIDKQTQTAEIESLEVRPQTPEVKIETEQGGTSAPELSGQVTKVNAEVVDNQEDKGQAPITSVDDTPDVKHEISQVRPWTRFWARMLDIIVFGIPVAFIIILIAPIFSSTIGKLFLGIIIALCWVFVEAKLLSSYGTTPGKWLLSIKLMTASGDKISYAQALNRSLYVWFRGLGMGIPLISAIAMALAAGSLRKYKITPWDKRWGFTVTHEKIRDDKLTIVVFIFAGIFALGIYERGFTTNDQTSSSSWVNATQRIHYDGLYLAASDNGAYWLRFYKDGTVIGVLTDTDGPPYNEDAYLVSRWFKKPYNNNGRYTIRGSNIEFSLTAPYGTIDFNGIINGYSLELQVYHNNNNKGTRKFEFVKIDLK